MGKSLTITRRSGGPRVQKLERAANGVLGRRKFAWRKVKVNGVPDRKTFDAVHMAAWLLGLSEAQLRKIQKGQITNQVFEILVGDKPRSKAMLKRDEERREESRKLRAKHRQKKKGLAGVKIHSFAPGAPNYGGTTDIMGQVVSPLLHGKYGYPIGSGKRTPLRNWEVGGSENSDHLTTKTLTFARDYPTSDGERAARELAKEFGWHSWQPNSFATFTFQLAGHTWRIQILWGAAIDHDDHIHVGIELVA